MTISNARIQISFTEEEKKALNIVDLIFNKIKVKDPVAFLTAFVDGDWVYYDYDDVDSCVCYEFEDNKSDDYDPPEDDF